MDFVNDPVAPEAYPKYEDVPLTHIDRQYKKVITWNLLFAGLFFAAIVVLFFVIDDWKQARWPVLAGYIPFMALWSILQIKAFERKAYVVRNHDVIYRHGILSVTTTVVPFNRIQHVSVREGMISRFYGLAAIQLFTAGGSAADLQIKGLQKETAEQIREIILEKIKK